MPAETWEKHLAILREIASDDWGRPLGDSHAVTAALARLADLEDRLSQIAHLASWHADLDADPENTNPEDMTAHINGLILRLCKLD